jgi:hypothetical protein
MSARPAATDIALPVPGPWHLGPITLARARQDDLVRAAVQSRVAADIRRSRGLRRYRLITGPVQRLAGIRARKTARRLATSH